MGHHPLRRIDLKLTLEHRRLHGLNWLNGQQAIDKQSIPLRRRHASRRGMRAGNQAHLLKVCHDIADRGRREIQAREF